MNASLGVALTGHWWSRDAIQRLARRADRLGYAVILIDGDTTMLPARPAAPVYDTSVLAMLTLAATRHARVGSIRLPAFWNAVLLARNLATLQDASGGRALGFLGVGIEHGEARLGLPKLNGRERILRLERTLEALRALLGGTPITRRSRFVRLHQAWTAPAESPVPLVVAAGGPRTLRVAERYADVWDANVPPLEERLLPLQERLSRPIETWIWIFARPGAPLDRASRDYRRCCPWFSDVPDRDLARALLFGDIVACRERLARLRIELGVDLPILDLAGLDEAAARRALTALAPAKALDFS